MTNPRVLSFFWHHIRPYKWYYAAMMIAPVVSSFYPFAYNYAIKMFLDVMETQEFKDYGSVLAPIVLFMTTQVMLDAVWRISNIAQWKSEPFVRRKILKDSYDYVQKHSYVYFQTHFTGTISSKLKGLLDGYDKLWEEIHHGFGFRLLSIIVSLGALLFTNSILGLFVLAWGFVYMPVMYVLSKRLNQLSFEVTESRHSIVGQLSDKISNIVSLFSFATRPQELHSLDKYIKSDFIPKQVKAYKYDFMIQIVGGLMYISLFAFILFYMVHLRISGQVSIGDFAFVFGMSLSVSDNIWSTTVKLQDFSRAMGDFRSSLSILQVPHQSPDIKNAKPLVIQSPKIEFKDISFGYDDDKVIFDKLNLTIQPGEKVGLVGPSGAGKSSIVNLLLRYYDKDQGQILVDGQDIAKVTQDSLRQQIAVIPQDTQLFHRTLLENIRYGNLDASNEDVIEASKKAHIHDFIQSLPKAYKTFVGERGTRLSGGQRQRVSIARAILKDAPILILDEATSSLDSQTELLIQESLNYLMEDKQTTVLAIAHRLSTLKHMDRILVLEKGKVIEEGTHAQLTRRKGSLYKKLWELQEI